MNIKPLLNRVLIKQDEALSQTKSGLIFPDNGKPRPLSGTIVAKGDEATLLSIGDLVLYEKYRGTEIVIENVEYMIMTQNDVIAKI